MNYIEWTQILVASEVLTYALQFAVDCGIVASVNSWMLEMDAEDHCDAEYCVIIHSLILCASIEILLPTVAGSVAFSKQGWREAADYHGHCSIAKYDHDAVCSFGRR